MWKAEKLTYREQDSFVRAYQGNEIVWVKPNTIVYRKGSHSDNTPVTPYNTSAFGGLSITSNTYSAYYDFGVITFNGSLRTIGYEAFRGKTQLDEIYIPSTVTSIGNSAFNGCSSIKNIDIQSVTSIGEYAFYGCRGLTSITLPSTITSIGDNAFYGCIGLTSITLPSTLTTIGSNMFASCTSLTDVVVENGVTNISSSMFAGCSSLASITLSNSLTTIGYDAFSGCTSLSSITLPNSLITIGDNAFFNCTSLTSINIPENVSSIGEYVFAYNDLSTITVDSNNQTYSDLNSNGIFANGTQLVAGCKNTVIPSSVTQIKSGAFYGCRGLTSIIIPSSVIVIYERALYTNALTTVIMQGTVPPYLDETYGSVFDTTNLQVIYVPVGSVNTYKTDATWIPYESYIVGYGYISYTGTAQVVPDLTYADSFGSGVNYICGLYNSNTQTGYMLFDSDPTAIKGDVFGSNQDLKTIVIPQTVTTIGDGHGSFTNTGLTSLNIPASVTSIHTGEFAGCHNLTNISVDSNNTVYDSRNNCKAIIETSTNKLIAGCKNTTIPGSVRIIGKQAFSAVGLSTITITSGVTTIEWAAFLLNRNTLTSVTIPATVTSIDSDAFQMCSKLNTVICNPTTPPTLGSAVFSGTSNTLKIYVPSGSVQTYKTASGWSNYASKIVSQ